MTGKSKGKVTKETPETVHIDSLKQDVEEVIKILSAAKPLLAKKPKAA
jgi:hypothetical protein